LLIGSVLFTILVCFKHIFIVFAPILGLFVLGSIFSKIQGGFSELLLISYSCAKILFVAFLPFTFNGQLKNIIERLFPIQRGLIHAYWAPNFWAIYSCLDLGIRRIFIFNPEIYHRLFKRLEVPSSTLCDGLTGEKSFSILPNITALTSIFIIGILHMVRSFFKIILIILAFSL
jgi:alpha-1,3-glucosyltransferase